MKSHNKNVKQVFSYANTINNTILNILLIYYILSNAVLPVRAIIADLTLHIFVVVNLHNCIALHGYFSLVNTSGPTTKTATSKVLL